MLYHFFKTYKDILLITFISMCLFAIPLLVENLFHKTLNSNIIYANSYLSSNYIVIEEENYVKVVKSIEGNPLAYNGKSISFYGIVVKPYKKSQTAFYVSRLLIFCCAADSESIGISVEWDKAPSLKEGEWVRVFGLLDSKKGKNNKFHPVIKAASVKKIKPMNQYVY